MINLKLSRIDMTMELGTGAAVSVIGEETYRDKLGHLPLQHTNVLLNTYSGERLPVLGQLSVNVHYKHHEEKLPLYIIKGCGPPLLGREWLNKIQLDWKSIRNITTSLDALLRRHRAVFDGTLKDFRAKLQMSLQSLLKLAKFLTPYVNQLKES